MKAKLPVAGRYWKRRIRSSMGENVVRAFVEMITNSLDSYKRCPESKKKIVEIKYDPLDECYVEDFAEGIPKDKFDRIISYGEKTSGIHEGKGVRGFFGIGLKDACLALNNAKISSIHNGKENTCYIGMNKDGEPEYEFIEINTPTNKPNGTKISFEVPKNFTKLDKRKLYRALSDNYLLRKINKSQDCFVILNTETELLGKNHLRNRIVYTDPNVSEELLNKEMHMDYPKIGKIGIKLNIKKAKQDLSQHGDTREGGVIIFFNELAVLDCTLAGFDNHTYARNLFGEMELTGFEKFLEKDEPVLSDERKGLDRTHPFIDELFKILNKEVSNLVKKEEQKNLSQDIKKVSSLNINRALGMINKIAQEELGDTDIITPPKEFEPDKFGFFFPYIDIFNYYDKTIILKINRENIKEDIEIISTNSDIEVLPGKVIFKREKGELYQKEKIIIRAKKDNIQGEIIAKTQDYTTKLLVNVLSNPKIKNDQNFYFYPNETFLIKNTKKDFSLILNKEYLKGGKIFLSSSSNIPEFQKEIKLEGKKYSSITEDLCEFKFQIFAKEKGKNIKINAQYNNLFAELIITEIIDSTPHDPKGFFKDIKEDSNRDPMELSSYEDGVIYIHSSNPIVKFYQSVATGVKDYNKLFHYRCIISKIVAERVFREIILEKDKRNNLPVLNLESSAKKDYIEYKIKEMYFKYGSKFIDVLIKREQDMLILDDN